MWDNLFSIIPLNLGFLAVTALLLFFPSLFLNSPILFYASLLFSILVFFTYVGTASRICRDISEYKTPQIRDIIIYAKQTYRTSIFFALINAVYVFLLSVALPTYLNFQSFFGVIAFSFLFWVTVLWIVSSEYFFPVQAKFGKSLKDSLKKMFLLFFDNTLFSLGLFVGCIAIFALSTITAFLLPGIASIFLWLNEALKIRLYKYDYLEEHPQANRKDIPWDVLLLDDKDRVGKRTFRGFIFPWKE